MIKTYRLRNLLMAEQLTAPELETLLQKKDYLGALYDLRNDKVWMADICQHPGAMAVISASETAMATIAASETALALAVTSKTAMEAIAASETAMTVAAASDMALVMFAASKTAVAAINDSSTAKEALFLSSKKITKSFGYSTTGNPVWWNVATGQGLFVRLQASFSYHHRIKIDGKREIPISYGVSDFFEIIPYTTQLDFVHYSPGSIHYIPFGA